MLILQPMRHILLSATLATASLLAISVFTRAQTTAPAFALSKAAIAMEMTNDQRVALNPPPGQAFLWVTAKASGTPQTIDLTKVAVAASGSSFPLVGVDSAWDGDPKQFSMIARARTKDGKTIDPLEETRSEGTVAFEFAPGKAAVLKVLRPPASVCLLFAVPQGFTSGQVTGLGAKPLPLPALTNR